VLTAVLFGLAASSALLIGALVGSRWSPPRQVTGVLLAFASGALISALAFELFEEAFELGGALRSGLGLLAGAAAFVIADTLLDRYVSGRSGPDQRDVVAAGARRGVGLALLAAVTLDGVPENVALGVSLVEGASLSLLVAIFFSNLPESLVGAVAMREAGQSARSVILTWTVVRRPARRGGRAGPGRGRHAGPGRPRDLAGLRRRGGPRLARGHADAGGVRARPPAQRLRHRRRILPLLRAGRLTGRCPAGRGTRSEAANWSPPSVRGSGRRRGEASTVGRRPLARRLVARCTDQAGAGRGH
jgi:ZIP family zinc transporter